MIVNLREGFTYKADFMIKDEAYAKLLLAAETFGNYNASVMLELYIESEVHNLRDVDRRAIMMLENCTISSETHFPSNFVTVTACTKECEAVVDPWYEEYGDVETQLEGAFRKIADTLHFISGELDTYDSIDNE